MENNNDTQLINILSLNGYNVVQGVDEVLSAINRCANDSTDLLCSGYGVFPDGSKCNGCKDCIKNKSKNK